MKNEMKCKLIIETNKKLNTSSLSVGLAQAPEIKAFIWSYSSGCLFVKLWCVSLAVIQADPKPTLTSQLPF